MHAVFEQFLRELIERGEIPSTARDEERLLAILEAEIQIYRERIPPPGEAVFQREVRQLRRTAQIFLHGEEEYCCRTGNRPLFLEVSIGLRSDRPQTLLDTPEPVQVGLGDGTSLRVRGRIDRVDKVGGAQRNAFAIWDYKTGSTWKYTQEPQPFWDGRVVQHYLYLLLLSARLRAVGKEFPGAKVGEIGFFFPSEKGTGERIAFTPKQLDGGSEVLAQLARIAAGGAFLATTRSEDCHFCDYNKICGDVVRLAGASQHKLSARANTILEPYRELRHDQGVEEAGA